MSIFGYVRKYDYYIHFTTTDARSGWIILGLNRRISDEKSILLMVKQLENRLDGTTVIITNWKLIKVTWVRKNVFVLKDG